MPDFFEKLGVAIVNLASGEDIIGTVAQGEGNTIVITKPLAPRAAMDDKGNMRIGMTPYRPYAVCDEVVVASERLNWILPATPEMAQAYQQNISPIQLAPASALNALPTNPLLKR